MLQAALNNHIKKKKTEKITMATLLHKNTVVNFFKKLKVVKFQNYIKKTSEGKMPRSYLIAPSTVERYFHSPPFNLVA